MHQKLPIEIDPFRLAKNGLKLEGKLALSSMPRLVNLLVNGEGEVDVKMHFEVDKVLAEPYMLGEFVASLALICERCTKPMMFDVKVNCSLAIMSREKKSEGLEEQYEPWIIDSSDPVLLSSIIEEELIFALPSFAKHEHDCLPAQAWFAKGNIAEEKFEKKVSPFAMLSQLKSKD